MPDHDELPGGLAALRWFGLHSAATIIEDYVRTASLDADTETLEEAEIDATEAYHSRDVSHLLEDALARRLSSSPDSFSPLS